MLSGHDIVYVCEGQWSFTRGGHMSSFFPRLAEHNRILYVDLPVASQYFYKYPGQGLRRLAASFSGPRKTSTNFYTWSPLPFIPFGNRDIKNEHMNRRLLEGRIRRVLAGLGFEAPLLIVQRYNSAPWFGAFGEKLSCYLCVDEYAYTVSSDAKDQAVMDIEAELLRQVDIVFCTAKSLVEDKSRVNGNCFFLENAADYEHFSQALDPALPIPDDIAAIPGPILGLIATTPQRLDFELLGQVAKTRPQSQIVLLGYLDSAQIDKLAMLDNVHYLGWRDFDKIPGYIKAFDVCLIPFKVNPQTNTMNPYKLHEYVAAGKPLVSTALSEVKDYAKRYPGVIYCANTPDEYITLIETALTEDKAACVRRRAAAARENTWEKRLEQFSMIVKQSLKQKSGEA